MNYKIICLLDMNKYSKISYWKHLNNLYLRYPLFQAPKKKEKRRGGGWYCLFGVLLYQAFASGQCCFSTNKVNPFHAIAISLA